MTRRLAILAIATAALATASCGGSSSGEWRSLFDGQTVRGWRAYKTEAYPPGWFVRNGFLTKVGPVEDIMSVGQFDDFELEFEWAIGPGGNAGVFYRATEEYDRVYWSAPEYQLLDDAGAPDGVNRLTAAGAAYGLYPSPEGHLKPLGEWNLSRIIVDGSHVEHWLNGEKLLEYDMGSDDWKQRVANSKFAEYSAFARARRGHIAIQGDHDGELAFRTIRIRELP